jgi:UDP-N-acetylmuramyl pentapeptide phosphotransferase/UDP-N-acetylglucosamine-1-phosphate transferase
MSSGSYMHFAPLVAAAVCLALLFVLVRSVSLPQDLPNERSLHSAPVPRSGGLAIVCGIMLTGPLFIYGVGTWLSLVAALSLVSFADDWRSLSARLRLAAHLLAAMALVYYMMPDLPLPLAALIVLIIVWSTNLYNFMDGADGLAGGMTLIGFSVYALAGWSVGNANFAWFAASIGATAAAFLAFNFPPARIFMGDIGSIPLGFLAAALGIYGWYYGFWAAWFPLLTFSPFIVDATLTLAQRAARGERFWQAHREHYYQRLVRMGLGHRKTALAEYVLMAAAGISALLLLRAPVFAQQLVLAIWALIYVGLAATVNKKWAAHLASRQHDSA